MHVHFATVVDAGDTFGFVPFFFSFTVAFLTGLLPHSVDLIGGVVSPSRGEDGLPFSV